MFLSSSIQNESTRRNFLPQLNQKVLKKDTEAVKPQLVTQECSKISQELKPPDGQLGAMLFTERMTYRSERGACWLSRGSGTGGLREPGETGEPPRS